jgi:hypothetical protein
MGTSWFASVLTERDPNVISSSNQNICCVERPTPQHEKAPPAGGDYAADRAFRQYDAADPANRLVAGELETRWNKALARVAEVEGKIAAHDTATVAPVADPASLGTLAADLRIVWTAPTTDARLKKRIVRTVIHEVIADIDADAAEIVLLVHWIGGVHSEIRLPKRRRGQRNSTAADVIAAVRQREIGGVWQTPYFGEIFVLGNYMFLSRVAVSVWG